MYASAHAVASPVEIRDHDEKEKEVDNDDEEEEYEEDDEDDDYDYEDEDEDDRNDEDYTLPASKMSLSLLKALGLDIPDDRQDEETDWRPPSQSGLQHSARKRYTIAPISFYIYRHDHLISIALSPAIIRTGLNDYHMSSRPSSAVMIMRHGDYNPSASPHSAPPMQQQQQPMSLSLMKVLGMDVPGDSTEIAQR